MRLPRFLTRLAALACGTLTLTVCRQSAPTSNIPDSTYVAVMAELKYVHEAGGLDTVERERRRAAVLERRGLTPAQLDTAARELARNPTRAQAVWQAIERRAADIAADSAGK